MRRGDRVSLASDPATEALVVKILGHDSVRVFWRRHPIHAGRCTVERENAFAEPVPVWVDEAGRRCATAPCPTCRRPVPLRRTRARTLWSRPDWQPFRVTHDPSWCGHPVPRITLPWRAEWWQEVLVWESVASA